MMRLQRFLDNLCTPTYIHILELMMTCFEKWPTSTSNEVKLYWNNLQRRGDLDLSKSEFLVILSMTCSVCKSSAARGLGKYDPVSPHSLRNSYPHCGCNEDVGM